MNRLCLVLIFLMASVCSMVSCAENVKVTVDVQGEKLSAVLSSLERQSRVKIVLQGDGGIPVTLTIRDVDLETAVKYVCLSAHAEFKRTEEGFVISSPNPVPQETDHVGTCSPTGNPSLLLVADFTTGHPPNNLGASFGTFNGDSAENACKAKMSFADEDALARKDGKSLRIDFENPSRPYFSGLWMSINPREDEDLGDYDRMGFWAKAEGISSFLLIVKDHSAKDDNTPPGVGQFRVTGLTGNWKLFEVPFKEFQPQKKNSRLNWRSIRQFVFVCIEEAKPSTGSLSIDEVYCSKGPRDVAK